MRLTSRQFETGLRDGTDSLSPYGDINWNLETHDSTPDVALEITDHEDFDIKTNATEIEVTTRNWFKSLNFYIDNNSSSQRTSSIDRVITSLIRQNWLVGPVSSETSLRLWFSKKIVNRISMEVAQEVASLFSLATFIDLEPGMTNEFQKGLEQVIEKFGSTALAKIQDLILNDKTASSIGLEALKYVGNADSTTWHNERRLMIETCLKESRSAWVRDGAGLGLSFLDDPRSIPALEEAIENESSKALKEDLVLVLNQLKETALES